MAEQVKESVETSKTITLDGKVITVEQLEEAKQNAAVRIVEDSNNPGQYRTLTKMKG